jgi:hypothetical protein
VLPIIYNIFIKKKEAHMKKIHLPLFLILTIILVPVASHSKGAVKSFTGKILADGQYEKPQITGTYIIVNDLSVEGKSIEFKISAKTQFIDEKGKKTTLQKLKGVSGIFGTYIKVTVSYNEQKNIKNALKVKVVEVHEGEGG